MFNKALNTNFLKLVWNNKWVTDKLCIYFEHINYFMPIYSNKFSSV